jgi:hypothetical protein
VSKFLHETLLRADGTDPRQALILFSNRRKTHGIDI